MVDANLTGYGQHKVKSINVEANLLDSWIEQRSALEQAVRRKVATFLLVCTFGGIMIPITWSLKSSAGYQAYQGSQKVMELTKVRNTLSEKAAALVPTLEFNQMLEREHSSGRIMLKEFAHVVNSCPPKLQFSSMKIEILSGELSVRVTALADSSGTARQFVRAASKGENVIDALQTGARKSQSKDSEQVTFDFIKKVKVGD